ncbi:hypothetical protein D3C78_1164810 [compost metagenome]
MRLPRLGREQQRSAARLTESFKQGQALTGVVDPGRCIDLRFHPSLFWSTAQHGTTTLYRPNRKKTLESERMSLLSNGAWHRLKFGHEQPIFVQQVTFFGRISKAAIASCWVRLSAAREKGHLQRSANGMHDQK